MGLNLFGGKQCSPLYWPGALVSRSQTCHTSRVWHNSDPNVLDRFNGVPLTSYFFHFTFACCFSVIFYQVLTRVSVLLKATLMIPFLSQLRKKLQLQPLEEPQAVSTGPWAREAVVVAAVAVGSFPSAVACMFIPIYHVLHDLLQVHTGYTVGLLFAVALAFQAFTARSCSGRPSQVPISKLLVALIGLYFTGHAAVAFLGTPEHQVSKGLHQPIGK